MILDYLLKVSTAQVVTASAGSTDVIDLGSARELGVGVSKCFAISVDEVVAAAGAATVSFSIQCDDNPAFSSPKTVITSDAFTKAALIAGREAIYLPIPPGLDERYIRIYYNVATGPLTTGKFSAAVVENTQSYRSYTDYT